MSTRGIKNMPQTSLDAYRNLSKEKLRKDYAGIIIALKNLKKANYETISKHLGWKDANACSRRLKEMVGMELIYKPGSKSLTSRNCSANDYALVENGEVSAQKEKVMPGPTIADISRKLVVQKNLFE